MNIETVLNEVDPKYYIQSKIILNHLTGVTDLKEQEIILKDFLHNKCKVDSEIYKLTQSFLNTVENEIAMQELEDHMVNEQNFPDDYIPAKG